MFVIVGWVLVIVCVIGSFVAMGGHVLALIQPFEFTIIFGAAFGAFMAGNPVKVLKSVFKMLPGCFKGDSSYGKAQYLQLIALLYELLQKGRVAGMLALEADVGNPDESPIFKKYEAITSDRRLRDFILDYLRMMISGNTDVTGVEDLMDAELETHHAEMTVPAVAMQKMADAMPAFGIVAAVMGVVHTMGSVGKPPAVLGEMVAAALVGTFLGILIGYGFVGPLAGLLDAKALESAKPLEVVKEILLASLNGYPPAFAVEFGRKVIFSAERPTFQELDDAIRTAKSDSSRIPSAAEGQPVPAA